MVWLSDNPNCMHANQYKDSSMKTYANAAELITAIRTALDKYLAEFADIAEADKHRRAVPDGKLRPNIWPTNSVGPACCCNGSETSRQAKPFIRPPKATNGTIWAGCISSFTGNTAASRCKRLKPDCVSRLPKSAHGWKRCPNRSYLSRTSADGQTTRQNGRSGNGCTSIRLRRLPTSERISANGKSRICMTRHML